MVFKTILNVTGIEQGDRDVALATGLCSQVDAHLSILVMALAAPPPVGAYAAVVSDAWYEERQADMERLNRRIAAVTVLLAKTTLSTDVVGEYSELAWADEAIGLHARYADLVVVGPELLAGETLKSKVVEGTLFSSATPLLLVPSASRPALTPKRVMVAWDTSFEASRAVRASLDMLARAGEVRLALVDPAESEDGHGAEPGANIAAFLARHGARVTVDRLPGSGQAVAEVLRRHAVDCSADLMVMGAYGHSRLRERVFGGVTKSMLDDPPLPVLMAR